MRKIIILIIFVCIFISSCGGNTTPETNIGGVDMQFLLNRPPLDEITEGQSFTIGIRLENNIPKDVECELCISDTPADSFGGIPGSECKDISIRAAEEIDGQITPELQDVYFPGMDKTYSYKNLPMGVDNTDISAALTYDMVSRASASVCLIKDPTTNLPGIDCPTSEILSGDQLNRDFAPVTVDRIEKSVVPEGSNNRLILDIYLKKSSQGDIVARSGNGEDDLLSMNIKLAGTKAEFSCTPLREGKVKLDEMEKKIRCYTTFKMNQDYYEDSLDITLGYTYRTVISTGSIDLNRKEEGF